MKLTEHNMKEVCSHEKMSSLDSGATYKSQVPGGMQAQGFGSLHVLHAAHNELFASEMTFPNCTHR